MTDKETWDSGGIEGMPGEVQCRKSGDDDLEKEAKKGWFADEVRKRMLRKVVGNDRSKEGRGKKWRNGEREKVDRRRGARRDCESRSRYNTGGYSHSESEKEKERVKKKKIVLVCGDVKKKKRTCAPVR
jgi:hypothetical protein